MPKFLIIRFSSIGDIVLTSPVVRCLKQQIPDAEIHFLTKPAYKFLLEHNPYIDRIHTLSHSIFETVNQLKDLNIDFIIDLHHNTRTHIIKSLLDAHAISFDKLNWEKTVMVSLKQDVMPNIHIVDRYLDTLSKWGVKNDNKGLDYFLPEGIENNIKLKQLLPVTDLPYTSFVIGAQHATKRLPTEKIVQLCRLLKNNVILLGGYDDSTVGEQVLMQSGLNIINLCGQLSFHESAYIVKNAQNVLAHDTGLMHVAAAFKKHIFSIWGNTIPEFGMYPYQTVSDLFQVKNLACRPCSKIGFNSCPQSHFNCMNQQDISVIATRINDSMS
jgi:ADP-heptose:LPS heptosyltransferase